MTKEWLKLAEKIYRNLPEQLPVDDGIAKEAMVAANATGLSTVHCARVITAVHRAGCFLQVTEWMFPPVEEAVIEKMMDETMREMYESKTDN